ncbi:MAG: ABC transporter ATP-binding protein [Treponema sp.]|nr:ABC transporter ATP-binding protein [Treponema sp.]
MDSKEIALKISNVSFSYKKGTKAISCLNLEVQKGSFTTLLGESGCGKTTILKLISGFLQPDSGTIEIDGVNQNRIEPDKRKIAFVFQNYALFPHLTVKQNILYGVKNKKNENNYKIFEDTVKSLNLDNLLNRYPHELSGGQQQRVALARSLVLNPKILLMDEPLSSLDTKLREKVRDELKEIQQKLKITTIYVTHDREEALSLSDKIAVIHEGKILQEGSPKELYFYPKNQYTADFIGHANFLKNNENTFLVRPQWFALSDDEQENDLCGKIEEITFLGDTTRLIIKLLGENFFSCEQNLIVDLPTIICDDFKKGNSILLKILKKWKL